MDRVARKLQAGLLNENHDDIKENYADLKDSFLKKCRTVDVLKLCDKGALNKCFSVYGCIPSSHFTNYIPIR